MHLIWVGRKQKYFCKGGLTPFLIIRSDLPVGLICRSPMQKFDLQWRQISMQGEGDLHGEELMGIASAFLLRSPSFGGQVALRATADTSFHPS
jgi:hypothetical protein